MAVPGRAGRFVILQNTGAVVEFKRPAMGAAGAAVAGGDAIMKQSARKVCDGGDNDDKGY